MRYISRYDEDSKNSAITIIFIGLFFFIFVLLIVFLLVFKTGKSELLLAVVLDFFASGIIIVLALVQLIPAISRLKHKAYLKNNGVAIKARVLNIQDAKFFDTFRLVRVSPFDRTNGFDPRFNITVGVYDRDNNCNRFFTNCSSIFLNALIKVSPKTALGPGFISNDNVALL